MFRTPAISDYVFFSTRTTTPLQVISVRRRPYINPYAILLVRTSSLRQRLLANHATTCSRTQTCVPKPYGLLQANFRFLRSLGIPSPWIHREAPSIFQLYLDSSRLLHQSLKQFNIHPRTHDTITVTHFNLHTLRLHVFSKHGVLATSLPIVVQNSVSHFFRSLGTCAGHEASLSLPDIIPKVIGQPNELNQTFVTVPPSLLQLPTRQLGRPLHLAEFAYNNTPSATTALHPSWPTRVIIRTSRFIRSMTLHPHALVTSSQISTSYYQQLGQYLPIAHVDTQTSADS